MRIAAYALLAVSVLLAGCHTDKADPTGTPASPYAGRSTADLQAAYDQRHQAHVKRCQFASPEQIKADQPWCEQDRNALAPLGNEIAARLGQQKP